MSIHVLDTTDEKPHSSLFRVKLTHTYTYTHTHTHTHTPCVTNEHEYVPLPGSFLIHDLSPGL